MSYNREAKIGDLISVGFLSPVGLTDIRIAICQLTSGKYLDFSSNEFKYFYDIYSDNYLANMIDTSGDIWRYSWDSGASSGVLPGEYLMYIDASGFGASAQYDLGTLVLSGTIITSLDSLMHVTGSQEVIVTVLAEDGITPISDARVEVQTRLGQIIAVEYTNIYGNTTFWLEPTNRYRLIVRAFGYSFSGILPINFSLGAYSSTPYLIHAIGTRFPITPVTDIDTCMVYGYLTLLDGSIPPVGTEVRFKLYSTPTNYDTGETSRAITKDLVIAYTDSDGTFSIPLAKGIKIKMDCQVTGDYKSFEITDDTPCPVNFRELPDLCGTETSYPRII